MQETSSHSTFVGSIPMHYDRHLGPVVLEPYAEDLAARVAGDGALRVLETACGTGIVTRHLLEKLPAQARVTASDLNEGMLALAGSKLARDPRVEFRVADAQDLPFEDGTYDAIACQFGIMFFPDKTRGLREARRVLRRGGRLYFNVWDGLHANPGQAAGHEVVMSWFPNDPLPFYETPFGWHDPDEINRVLAQAGFGDVRILALERKGACESHESLASGLVRGNPVLNSIEERGGDVEAIVAAVARRLAEVWPEPPFQVPLRALVVEARA